MQNLPQALILDIIHREVYEDAGLYIAAGIDMEVIASSGDAATGMGGIAPEVTD